ncbi:MAG: DNA-binding response regulator, partial [Symbiobacteriaceae bacterium]
MAYNLRRAGFEVLTADNGEDGLRIAREEAIDLLILDVM